MKYTNWIWSLLLLLSFSACQPDTVKTTITFHYQLNGTDMPMMQNFSDDQSVSQRTKMLRFYISDLNLIDKDGNSVALKDYDLVSINTSGSSNYSLTADVAPGTYKSISFAIGLNSSQRSVDPTTLPTTDPRSDAQDMYWSMGSGTYIFVKYEGEIDANTDGLYEKAQIYHVADYSYYRTVNLSGSDIKLGKKEDNQIDLYIQHDKIFSPGSGGSQINELSENYSQSTDTIATHFTDNFANSFSY